MTTAVFFCCGRLAALLGAAAWRLTNGVVLTTAALRPLGPPSTSKDSAREAAHGRGGGEVVVPERSTRLAQPLRPYTALGYMSNKLGQARFPRLPWTTLELLNQTTGSPMVAFNPSLVRRVCGSWEWQGL